MSFADLFSENADRYASARPRYPDQLFAFVASQAPSRERAWDCGTGNGQAAISLAEHFAEVCASDPSQDQINQALARPNVVYSVQRAEHTTFPAQHFDAICVAQALHWFDFAPFFAEVTRLAKPRAIFAAWGYSWPSVTPRFDAVFRSALLSAIEPYWAPQNRLLWNGYAEVPFPFRPIPTPEFQIEVSWTFSQFMAYVATWSATRACSAARGAAFLHDAVAVLQPAWGIPDEARTIRMPLVLRAGHVA